jgi:bacteriocin-like protein
MTHFETVTDRDLQSVTGGLSFSVDFAKGLSLDSKLVKGSVALPKPSDLLSGLSGAVSQTIDSAGELLELGGQLFDFI